MPNEPDKSTDPEHLATPPNVVRNPTQQAETTPDADAAALGPDEAAPGEAEHELDPEHLATPPNVVRTPTEQAEIPVGEPDALIGGPICHTEVAATLLNPEDKFLSQHQRDCLWEIFVEIGRCWGNLPEDSISVKSSWLEFVQAKTEREPTYIGEYANAAAVVQELIQMYGRPEAFRLLFLKNGIPKAAPTTRLAHAKRYVVDEFIRVQIVASGFKGFVPPPSLNYNGYVGGSRYNRLPRARLYTPNTEDNK